MSDAPAPAPDVTGATPSVDAAPSAPVTDASTSSSAPATGDDVFGDLPEQPIFDRGYVDKLRREGAKYRSEARTAAEALAQYNEVFGVYEQPDREVWLDLARTWASDPRSAASVMQQIAQAVLSEGGDVANVDPAAPPATDAPTAPLTSEQVQQMVRGEFEAVERQRAQAAAVESIYAEVRAAGFDPKSRDGFAILWTANNETNGDIKAAIESFKADRQKIIDEYVQQRATGKHGALAPANGVVASASTSIKNMDDARRAADAFLRAQVGE